MKKHIYYHLYLPDEHAAWSNYLLEQYKPIEDNFLIDAVDKFHLVLVGKPKNIEMASRLASVLIPKLEIHTFEDKFKSDKDLHTLDTDLHGRNERPMTEYGTLCLIADHARREDAHFLYMHAKGVTSYERCLRAGRYEEFRNYLYWRKFLEWAVVERWQECNSLLERFDVVGCNYSEWPMKHFSGNYWWSKSEYIKNIAHINDDAWWASECQRHPDVNPLTWRLRDEMWICHGDNAKMCSLKNADRPPPHGTLAVDLMRRRMYAGYN